MNERIIKSGASPFERFQVGDHVAHISNGDGEVVGNDGASISVKFRGDLTGIYDANWFHVNHKFLFHRDTAPLKNGDRT